MLHIDAKKSKIIMDYRSYEKGEKKRIRMLRHEKTLVKGKNIIDDEKGGEWVLYPRDLQNRIPFTLSKHTVTNG